MGKCGKLLLLTAAYQIFAVGANQAIAQNAATGPNKDSPVIIGHSTPIQLAGWVHPCGRCTLCEQYGQGGGGGGGYTAPSEPPVADIAAREAYSLNEQGRAYYNNKNWKLAEQAFRAALAKTPNAPAIRHNLANTLDAQGLDYYNNKDLKRAVEAFRAATEEWPESEKIKNDYKNASDWLNLEEAEKTRQQQETLTADNMRKMLLESANKVSQSPPPTTGGLEFAGRNGAPGANPVQEASSGGLNFMQPGNAGLKVDSSVVDLRFLDPNSPIFIDPNVVKGRERTFPVQFDPETYKNANHNKGVEALKNNDPDLAVRYFEAARKERPNDPIIHNMLLLSQDIARVHQEQEARANTWILKTWGAIMYGDPVMAKFYLGRARDLAPNDKVIRSLEDWVALKNSKGYPWTFPDAATMNAFRLAGNAFFSFANRDFDVAVKNIEAAQAINPGNTYIANLARSMREAAAKQSSTNTQK